MVRKGVVDDSLLDDDHGISTDRYNLFIAESTEFMDVSVQKRPLDEAMPPDSFGMHFNHHSKVYSMKFKQRGGVYFPSEVRSEEQKQFIITCDVDIVTLPQVERDEYRLMVLRSVQDADKVNDPHFTSKDISDYGPGKRWDRFPSENSLMSLDEMLGVIDRYSANPLEISEYVLDRAIVEVGNKDAFTKSVKIIQNALREAAGSEKYLHFSDPVKQALGSVAKQDLTELSDILYNECILLNKKRVVTSLKNLSFVCSLENDIPWESLV